MSERSIITQMIPLSRITIAQNVRTSTGLDKASIKELADSIKELGLLQPIIVAEHEGGFAVIAGQRRTLACQMAGLTEVLCIVRGAETGGEELKAVQIVENLKRENLGLSETCEGVREMLAMVGKPAEVAKRLSKSSAWVSKHLSVTGPTFSADVRDMVNSGQCNDVEMALTLNQIAKHPKGSTVVAHLIAQVKAGLIGRAKVRATLEQLKAPAEEGEEGGEDDGDGEGGEQAPKGKQTISVELSAELAAVFEAAGGATWLRKQLKKLAEAQRELPV
ncbi:ParB/RepB/Spo0J family partition protein [Roseateles sp. BYS78W]|uniref:ParB/RepB/Spo0J family partition protein n=1 Tax=Pelomonas candidula TaxID=3299025 RepID=A0ABW7H5P0_9BURK